MEPGDPPTPGQSLNHWATGEFPLKSLSWNIPSLPPHAPFSGIPSMQVSTPLSQHW